MVLRLFPPSLGISCGSMSGVVFNQTRTTTGFWSTMMKVAGPLLSCVATGSIFSSSMVHIRISAFPVSSNPSLVNAVTISNVYPEEGLSIIFQSMSQVKDSCTVMARVKQLQHERDWDDADVITQLKYVVRITSLGSITI